MLRRNLIGSVPALAAASLLASTSVVVPQLAHAAKPGRGYGKKILLKDVEGKASAYVKKGHYFKKYDRLKFEDDIVILKFLFYRHQLIVEGIIYNVRFKDKWHRQIRELYIDKAAFKAPATLRKDKKGHWPWDDHGKKRRRRPRDDDYDLYLDIGQFKVVEYDKKDRYRKSLTVYLLNPDEQELDVKDRKLKDYLTDKASDGEYDYKDKADDGAELD